MHKKFVDKNFRMILLVGAVFLLSISLVMAVDLPTYNQFYGSISFTNGSRAFDGMSVEAYSGGFLSLSGVSLNGKYGYEDVFIIENLRENDTISFYVNGSFMINVQFRNEDITNLNFTINSSVPVVPIVCSSGTTLCSDNVCRASCDVCSSGNTRCSDGVCRSNCGGGSSNNNNNRVISGSSGTRTTIVVANKTTTPAFSFEQSIKKPLLAFLSDQYENNRVGLIILIILFSIAILLIAIVLILFVVRKLRSQNSVGINPVAEREKRVADWKQLEKEKGIEEQKNRITRLPIVGQEIKPVAVNPVGAKPLVKPLEVTKPIPSKSFFAKFAESFNPSSSRPAGAASSKSMSVEGHGLARPAVPIKSSAPSSSAKPPVNALGGNGSLVESDGPLRVEISKGLVEGRAALNADDFGKIRASYNTVKRLYNSLKYRDYKTYYAILDFYNEIIKLEY